MNVNPLSKEMSALFLFTQNRDQRENRYVCHVSNQQWIEPQSHSIGIEDR